MKLYERFPLTTGTPKSKSPSAARLTYFKSFPIVEQPGCSSVNVDFQTTNEVLFINETAFINMDIFSIHGWESVLDEG